jgi:uncharacterized protein with beta-barrel porin domain
MATFTNKKLANPIVLGVAPTVMYTCPANVTTVVSAVTIATSTGSVVNFSLHLCPVGASPDVTNVLLSDVPIGGLVLTANFNFGQMLQSGDSIQAYADTAGVITMHASGIEIS